MTVPRYGVDTRRTDFAATIDLAASGPLVDVLRFDVPETLREAERFSLVSQTDPFRAGADIGFREGDSLSRDAIVAPGGVLTLALATERLRQVWFERVSAGILASTPLAIGFATVAALPRGAQSFGPRRLAITARVQAPAPEITVAPQPVRLDRTDPSGGFSLGRLIIQMPADLIFEDAPALLIEAATEAALAPQLRLAVDPLWSAVTRLVEEPAHDPRLRRWRLGCPAPGALAGQAAPLEVTLAPGGVLALVDAALAAGAEAPRAAEALAARIGWRLTGWFAGNGLESAAGASRRLWRINPCDLVAPVSGAGEGLASVTVGDRALTWPLGSEGAADATGPSLAVDYDPDAPGRGLSLPDLPIAIRGWPIGLGASVNVALSAAEAGEAQSAHRATLSLTAAMNGRERTGEVRLPGSALAAALAPMVAKAAPDAATWRGALALTMAAGPHTLRIALPAVARPRPRRAAMVIDLGATAAAIWCAPVEAGPRPSPLELLRLGPDGPLLCAQTEPPNAAAGARDTLLPPPLPDQPARPAFEAGASPLAAASARRRSAPKTALSPRRPLFAAASADTRRPVEVVSDALSELVMGHVLPLRPALRQPEDSRLPLIPRLVLTYPEGACGETRPAWEAAAQRLRRALEPCFPGITAAEDAVTLVAEGLAAGRYAASLEASGLSDERLITLDVGASASHVSILALGAGRSEPLIALSVPVGGDDIQAALVERITGLLDPLLAVAPGAWARLDGGRAAGGAGTGSDNPARSAMRDVLATAVTEAQLALADALPAGDPWQAPDAAPLVVTLARFGGASEPQGALLPLLAAPSGEGRVAEGVRWRIIPAPGGERRLQLLLSPPALQGASEPERRLAQLLAVIATTLPRMALSGLPARATRPSYALAVTGRGALWPPLHAAILAAGRARGDRLCRETPLPAAAMKLAVSAGAALLAAEGPAARQEPPAGAVFALAVLGLRVTAPSESPAETSGRTAFVTERLYYLTTAAGGMARAYEAENPLQPSLSGRITLGRRFALVRAAPGLDPEGRLLADIRTVAEGWEPVQPLQGDSIMDATDIAVAAFGPCDIGVEILAGGEVSVRISALNHDWTGAWRLSGDQAVRLEPSAQTESTG